MKRMLTGNGKFYILILFFVSLVSSLIGLTRVNVNYDLAMYLPEDSNTAEGLEILDNTFGNHAVIQIMLYDISIQETLEIKEAINTLEPILYIDWLDEVFAQTPYDLEAFDFAWLPYLKPEFRVFIETQLKKYHHENTSLLTIYFHEDDYSLEVQESIGEIEKLVSEYRYDLRGEAILNREMREIAENETYKILLIIVPICVLILLIASKSWLEPFIILSTLLIAVALNMGTNVVFNQVSFITITLASALQLAISLDYSLFILHRYYEEEEEEKDNVKAVLKALRFAFPSVTASALTTMTGFMALSLMRYGIGKDIGFVLVKGILFSYLTAMILLPITLVIFSKLIKKTMHKTWMPPVHKLVWITSKFKVPIGLMFLLIIGISFYGQRQTTYIYGNNQFHDNGSEIAISNQNIEAIYGPFQQIAVLYPDETIDKEILLTESLLVHPHILLIDGLVAQLGPEVKEETVDPVLWQAYRRNGFTRLTLYTDIQVENQELYDFTEEIYAILNEHLVSYHVLGSAFATYEIREIVIDDALIVSAVSVLAIGIIIMFVFKSIPIPVILITIIQTSIWLNIAYTGFRNISPIFIGYLVVFSLQLGATIDYAVLLTHRYREHRSKHQKKQALHLAIEKASTPIIISALVLATAGFAEAFTSDLTAIKEIGYLIGRGALISLFMILFVLPSCLLIFDRILVKNTENLRIKD